MFKKIVINEFMRKKIISLSIFTFITIAVLLGSSALSIISRLIQSMADLKEQAVPADIAQMHSGAYEQRDIDAFVSSQKEHIALQETVVLLNFEGSSIHIGENRSLAGTIQDISFVVQNEKFDFILDLDNKKLQVQKGYAAVPVYFMREQSLSIGDTFSVVLKGYTKEFIISDYARDYEMSSSLTSSKRFVINEQDFNDLYNYGQGEIEYLIEFKLTENADSSVVQKAYIEAGLPANGPNIEGCVFSMLNAMSDAVVSLVIILISLLLIVIALLCIRLSYIAALEEDIREIGVMKAVGISKKDVKKVYLAKYKIMSLFAGLAGYGFSFLLVQVFTENMRLYFASDVQGWNLYILPLLSPILVYVFITVFCKKELRKLDKISVVNALRLEGFGDDKTKIQRFPLKNTGFLGTNVFMGVRDVFIRFKLYRLIVIIFAVCTFLAVLPINLYSTMTAPDFITYMGIGPCDMRIDIRRSGTIKEDCAVLAEKLRKDKNIEKFAAYTTCYYEVQDAKGVMNYVPVETGDFSLFPLKYLEGNAPQNEGEIALSYANTSADALGKKTGDEILIRTVKGDKMFRVSGVYQDITNGGKTAKAHSSLGINEDAVLWYIVYMTLIDKTLINSVMEEYQREFPGYQVNDAKEYARQTMGNIHKQLLVVLIAGLIVSVVISVLITALFIQMLLSKDTSQIAILRSIGLAEKSIRKQYTTGTTLTAAAGILIGLFLSDFLGERLISFFMTFMGAAQIRFFSMIWPLMLSALALFIAALQTVRAGCRVKMERDISNAIRK